MSTDTTATSPASGDRDRRRPGLVGGLLRTARPKQWVKNLLVFAAPAAAGAVFDAGVMADAALAFVAFVAASAGTYLVNDAADAEKDALHPVKRRRPVAAGIVPVPVAWGVGLFLMVASVVGAWLAGEPLVALVVGVYVVNTFSYSLLLKQKALVDLVSVGAGFVLRAIAGAVATDLEISQWFLIVTSFGALYVVTTKRYAEYRDQEGESTRSVLAKYTEDVLQEIRFTAAAAAIVAYVLWAFENAQELGAPIWFELSIVPFVLAIYRYALAVHEGAGESPEEIFLGDRPLVLYGTLWAVVYGVGLVAG